MPRLRAYLGFHLLRVFMVRLDDVPPLRPEHSQLHYAALSGAQLLAWCGDPELELDAKRVQAALARGDLCIGVSDHGRPVGYVWFSFGPAPHIHGAWVRIEPRARYLYKAFIRPAYRGRRISAELYIRASQVCPRRGRTLGVLAVDADNTRGLMVPRRAGWVEIGYAGFLRCLGGLLAFRSPGARKYGFSFFARQ